MFEKPAEAKKPILEQLKKEQPVVQITPAATAKSSETIKTSSVELSKQVIVQEQIIPNGNIKTESTSVKVEKQKECNVSDTNKSSAVEKLRNVEKTEISVGEAQVENFSVGVEVNVAVDDMSRRYASGISSSARAG